MVTRDHRQAARRDKWFHPHPHGKTAGQVYAGLAGMMIVSDGPTANGAFPQPRHG